MANFNYILSYNPAQTNPSVEQLHLFISKNRDIESWYLAFLGTYIIKSDKYLDDLNSQFVKFFGGSSFILTWQPFGHATGLLPSEIWEWFNNQHNPFLPRS